MTGERGSDGSSSDQSPDFDIVHVCDARVPSERTNDLVEEIEAESAAGFWVGVVSVPSPKVSSVSGIDHNLARQARQGKVTILSGFSPRRAKLLILRDSRLTWRALKQLSVIGGREVYILARPDDGTQGDEGPVIVADVDSTLTGLFDFQPVWVPISGPARVDLEGIPGLRIAESTWPSIAGGLREEPKAADVANERRTPVVGIYTRLHHGDQDGLRLPFRAIREGWDVRILGNSELGAKVLGREPEPWRIYSRKYPARHEMFSHVDFLLSMDDREYPLTGDRVVLEAMQSGVPALLPPQHKNVYGTGPVYAHDWELEDTVQRLWSDTASYRKVRTEALETAQNHFSHAAHIKNVEDAIGLDSVAEKGVTDARSWSGPTKPSLASSKDPKKPRILLVSSNGTGMGHLTRLLSYARKLDDPYECYFMSMSQAAPVVASFGYDFEYLPSAKTMGFSTQAWRKVFETRMVEVIRRVGASAVIFDGTFPYAGITSIQAATPGVPWVWSRRGMWRPDVYAPQLARSHWFDMVLEPGDLAASYDRGQTARADAHRVPPVTLYHPQDRADAGQIRSRQEARDYLGLPQDRKIGLVTLGAGRINDINEDLRVAVESMSKLGMKVAVTKPQIAQGSDSSEDVQVIRDYPLARSLAAFDVAVSASGYNSFHELLRGGVPTLFVPNLSTSLDDQWARAEWAADHGHGAHLESLTPDATMEALDMLTNSPPTMERLVRSDSENGTMATAEAIGRLLGREVPVTHG